MSVFSKWWHNRIENDVAWKVDIQTIIGRGYDLDIKNPNKPDDVHEFTSAELIEMLEKSMKKSNELLIQLKSELK
jgi:type I restriction enzyme M protein